MTSVPPVVFMYNFCSPTTITDEIRAVQRWLFLSKLPPVAASGSSHTVLLEEKITKECKLQRSILLNVSY
jgi:hypothetical protein